MTFLRRLRWKHWAVILGAPALSAFVEAYNHSGECLTRVALEHDALAPNRA